MKKLTLLFVLSIAGISAAFSQKKTNGTIYIEHPAITVVNNFFDALLDGDSAKMAGYLTDDFQSYDGISDKMDYGMSNKADFIEHTSGVSKAFDYLSFKDFPGSYPDAMDYKKDNTNGDITVFTWKVLSGVHKKTGVQIDANAEFIFTVTKDNKIKRMIEYTNPKVFDEIAASMVSRTNGTIYNHHENINTVRKAMYAFEKGDIDKCQSYFSDAAKFYDVNKPFGQSNTLPQERADWESFLKAFEIEKIDVFGYPDYLQYEKDSARVVLSWWKFYLVRKSDQKKLMILFHFVHQFDAAGKITSEVIYYGGDLLKE